MAENKVKFGVKNVHFALLIEGPNDSISFGTPVAFPGAVSLSVEPVGETNNFRADNTNYYVSVSNNGYEGTYEVAEIPIEFRTQVLGDVLSSDGILTESNTVKPKRFALMYEFDGDIKANRHVLYNCTATRPTDNSETTGESIEPVTSELTFTATALPNGVVKRRTTSETSDAIYDEWYDAVYLPVPTP